MVRYYKKQNKKSEYQYTEGCIKLAIDCVQNGESIKSAAAKYGIPRTTLQNKFKNGNVRPASVKKGFTRTFTDEQEKALCEYIVEMESRLMGLSTKELRKLGFDFAEELKISHPFNKETRMTGKDWMISFMRRHNLSNRKPQNTSAARANGFKKEAVDKFFFLLKEIQDKHNIPASSIWNVDETSTSTVPKSTPRVIASKGRKQVGGKTSAERGENVTAEICMSASGVFMPPMLVFPRVRPNPTFLEGKPEGSWAEWDKSGYVNSDSFLVFLKKFIEFTRASNDNPQILLLDGHHSHVKNLAVAKLAKEQGVIILCFPPHCTHRMQPLDVSFMKPLSLCYSEEIKAFQRNGALIQMKNIFSVFGKAWQRAAKVETAVNAFKATGIVPLNVHIFDHHFQSSGGSCSSLESSTNAECVEECKQIISNIVTPKRTKVQKITSHASSCDKSDGVNETSESLVGPEKTIHLSVLLEATKPLISFIHNMLLSTPEMLKNNSPHELLQSVQEIQQCIQATTVENPSKQTPVCKKRMSGTAAIITDDAYIQELEMAEKVKKIKKEPKAKLGTRKSKPKINNVQAIPKGTIVVEKSTPFQVIQRQPLGNFNYQYTQQNTPIHFIQPGISAGILQSNNATVCANATIVDGAVVIEEDDGILPTFYVT